MWIIFVKKEVTKQIFFKIVLRKKHTNKYGRKSCLSLPSNRSIGKIPVLLEIPLSWDFQTDNTPRLGVRCTG